jgi:putative endonuclease
MHYVYRIRSQTFPERHYTGFASDLRQRLLDHNNGCCDYTRPFRPWSLEFYAAFQNPQRARNFERYLKSDSGFAFANKRL